ncbi:MAG TPA: hypothetical protein VK925_04995, partial [Jiangellaceae bacterium]|nr:hypothetical protein [Jiangellaceae bacterium]
MPSITTWSRLEPSGPARDGTPGAVARIWDPLWLLGRQWQVGEFRGEDGGTPIVARWRGQVTPLGRFWLGRLPNETQTSASRLDLGALPLETFVERQRVGVAADLPTGVAGLRLAVEAGQHFLRLLAEQETTRDYRPAFVAAYAVQRPTDSIVAGLDPATLRYLDLVAGRALDGRRLRAELADRDLPRLDPPVGTGDRAEVREACANWLPWLDELFSQPEQESEAWQVDRMEHAFSVTARLSADPFDEYTLTAAEYPGGELDWYSVDRNGNVNLGTTPAEAGPIVTQTVIPAPLTVRGVPAPRFWEFEDALLDLGALQPGPTELPQLLMLEAMSGYGNDWYLIPIDLPVGTVTATRSLVIIDTFGAQTLVRPNGDRAVTNRAGWSLFELAMPFDDLVDGVPLSNGLFLAPSVVQPLEGPALEEVLLARDELANIAWAIERRLESPLVE